MNHFNLNDPYSGNILIQRLGKIKSPNEVLKQLTQLPSASQDLTGVPYYIRIHYLQSIRDLYLPGTEACSLHTTIDLMIRKSYEFRDPEQALTWAGLNGDNVRFERPLAPPMGAIAVGISGTGKSQSILRCLRGYPQIINHKTFPTLIGPHNQLVYMSSDVPASGSAFDLGVSLMRAFQLATGSTRFDVDLARYRRDGMRMLDDWRQVALGHFLGCLHLDEVQNFFKISSLDERRRRTKGDTTLLSIKEDQCIKWILSMMNTWQIPLILSGTPDGIAALSRRLSNTERFISAGYHSFKNFQSASDLDFKMLIHVLTNSYQFVTHKLAFSDALAELILDLTGGIHRVIIALWIAAHRMAFLRSSDELRIEDFTKAANTLLAPIAPAIDALKSNDPKRLNQYEDLLPDGTAFWSQLWSPQL